MEIKGKVIAISKEQVVSEKFKKIEFAIETADQYPQQIPMQFVNDKCLLAQKLTIGCEVTAHINLKGKKYQNKTTGADAFFLSLECWKIEADYVAPTSTPHKPVLGRVQGEDDLPF